MLRFAFYKAPGGWRDKAIRLASCSRYSHVEFVIDGPLPRGTAICVSASKRDGNKVRSKPICLHRGHWDFVSIAGDYKAARKYALSKCGTRYNVLGAVLSVTPIKSKAGDGLFCSEFMALICEAGGVDIPDAHTINPGELFETLMRRGASFESW